MAWEKSLKMMFRHGQRVGPQQGLRQNGLVNGTVDLEEGITYADQETYYVVNDAQDQEYLGSEDFVKYFPRGDVKIGDLKSDVTKQYGAPWGGLGLRVSVRGFQWNNPQARDAIFLGIFYCKYF